MKYLFSTIIIALFAVGSAFGQDNAIEKYFEQYLDDERFSMVYVSPKMFKMVNTIVEGELEEEITDVIKDLRGLRILKTEIDAKKFYTEAKSKINTREYEILMTARDEGKKIEFLTKESNDIIEELLLLVGEKEEFIMMSFIGKIDLKKISKLAKALDIDGAEHLGKLGED